jgi:hypothetical protein
MAGDRVAPQYLQPGITITTELQRIQDYVSATSAHIGFLEAALRQPRITDQILELRTGLKSISKGLEKLECRVDPRVRHLVKRRIGDICRGVKKLEIRSEKIAKDGTGAQCEAGTDQSRHGGLIEDEPGDTGAEDHRPDIHMGPFMTNEEFEPLEEYSDSVATSGSEPNRKNIRRIEGRHSLYTPTKDTEWWNAEMIRAEEGPDGAANAISSSECIAYKPWKRGPKGGPNGDDSFSLLSAATENDTSVSSTAAPVRPYMDVLCCAAKENLEISIEIIDSDRVRIGSAPSWFIADAIQKFKRNTKFLVPHSKYIKPHEIRAFTEFLEDRGCLQHFGSCPMMERLMYLLILLEEGCRFEVIAVYFSRAPNDIVSACLEVSDGILELHDEMVLPPSKHGTPAQKYLYEHCWQIVQTHPARSEEGSGRQYYPWSFDELCKMLVTLNIFIGRFRRQGRFALDGPILNWGKYHRE